MQSDNLSLPFIQPSQAQKHVTHNEALQRLDAVVQLSVKSASDTAPPANPTAGERYILPAGVTGAWSGFAGQLAVYENMAWQFYTPSEGWFAWVSDIDQLWIFDGTTWGEHVSDLQNVDMLGVNTTADATNRVAVSSDAVLLTHAGTGHQLKVNKASAAETASLLFQTGWSGRAEMGTTGSDDFELKVSNDGTTFHTALQADGATGKVHFPAGASGVAPAAFGTGDIPTVDYIASRGADLVTNGTGLLGNAYNYPAEFTYDPVTTPNLPASFSFAGYHSGTVSMQEFLAVDPNQIYRLSCYLRQESTPGDWSAYANGERHTQYMGLLCLDADKQTIWAYHHMRYKAGGIDSLTALASPLAPGDTSVHLVNASGWNDASTAHYNRGLIIFGYRNTAGLLYERYSRIAGFDLFDLPGVNKAGNTITLKAPLPASMGNPDDPGGVWPAGTKLANSTSGGNYKYSLLDGAVVPTTDTWYFAKSHMGGVDRSGTNVARNFPPGTAYVKPFWLPNYSNRAGGLSGYPDTGAAQRIWFAGVSVKPDTLATAVPITSGSAIGSFTLHVPTPNPATGQIEISPASMTLTQL